MKRNLKEENLIELQQEEKDLNEKSNKKISKNICILDRISDDEFKEIINNCRYWKDIGDKLGYKNTLTSVTKQKIIDRCNNLNITLNLISKQKLSVNTKTKKELQESRKNYQSYRSAIRKAAEKTFKNAHLELKCAICGYDKHIEIAHIKAVSDFDDDVTIEEINSLDNLIALCPNHHWEYDHKILTLQ